ncbi:MAG: hypothetical protein H0X13_19840 [Ramlibacter sp.]|nr:hypothetical protein [Ramlibacter sp.]
MTDLFGFTAAAPVFVDIRSQRESVAEKKAWLAFELNSLCKTPPRSLNSASINAVRAWRLEHKKARKVLANKRSSRTEMMSAINTMRGFE